MTKAIFLFRTKGKFQTYHPINLCYLPINRLNKIWIKPNLLEIKLITLKFSKGCQMSKNQTAGIGRKLQKKKLATIRFTHHVVNLMSHMKVIELVKNTLYGKPPKMTHF